MRMIELGTRGVLCFGTQAELEETQVIAREALDGTAFKDVQTSDSVFLSLDSNCDWDVWQYRTRQSHECKTQWVRRFTGQIYNKKRETFSDVFTTCLFVNLSGETAHGFAATLRECGLKVTFTEYLEVSTLDRNLLLAAFWRGYVWKGEESSPVFLSQRETTLDSFQSERAPHWVATDGTPHLLQAESKRETKLQRAKALETLLALTVVETVKLKPRLRSRNIVWPGIFAKT